MNSGTSDQDYNPIFGQFVDLDADDHSEYLQGIVAYGLYKIAKREWASRIRDEDGRKPTEEELKGYIQTWTPAQIDGKREQAAQALAAYASEVIAEARPLILREALQGSFFRSFWPSFWATVAYSAALILVATLLYFLGVDILSVFQKVSAAR